MKYFRFLVLLICALLLAVSFKSSAEEKKGYTLAIVPQMPAVEIFSRWTPFVKKLSEEVGVRIDLATYSSIPEFEANLLKGVPDFAYMNPYHEVMAKDAQGYAPLVKNKTALVGIIVVHKDSGIKSVKDLNGKTIAFPAPNAFAASLYMRALLTEKEKIDFTPAYMQTHSNVYRAVVLNKATAGGGVESTLMKESEGLKNYLKVLYETPESASHPISAHPRVPDALRKKVVSAILKLASDQANKSMFDNIQIAVPVAANYEKDYLPLKKLKLEKYSVTGTE